MKNVVVVDDGLTHGGEEVAELVSSMSYFEGDSVDNLEGGSILYGIKYGMV